MEKKGHIRRLKSVHYPDVILASTVFHSDSVNSHSSFVAEPCITHFTSGSLTHQTKLSQQLSEVTQNLQGSM